MAFVVEVIPDEAILFRRIHKALLVDGGKISSAAYGNENLSVNWEKYSNPAATADENSAYVTSLVSGQCRALGQMVEHKPLEPDQEHDPNQAHAEIIGKKRKQIKQQLRDLAV